MTEEKILTRHPEGKHGVNIDRNKYEVMREAIVAEASGKGEVSLKEVRQAVEGKLKGTFEGSIPWYFETVKLDLEARNIIARVPGRKPQHIILV